MENKFIKTRKLLIEVSEETDSKCKLKIYAENARSISITEMEEENRPSIEEACKNKKEDYINSLAYMGPVSLPPFIAELYCYIVGEDFTGANTDLIKMMENALWLLNDYDVFEESIDIAMDIIEKELCLTPLDEDRMLFRVMNYHRERNDLDYYMAKAKEYTEKYHLDIKREKELKAEIARYIIMNDDAIAAVQSGKDAYETHKPITSNPHECQLFSKAWTSGYELARIEEVWRNVLR